MVRLTLGNVYARPSLAWFAYHEATGSLFFFPRNGPGWDAILMAQIPSNKSAGTL